VAIDADVDIAVRLGEGGILRWEVVCVFLEWKREVTLSPTAGLGLYIAVFGSVKGRFRGQYQWCVSASAKPVLSSYPCLAKEDCRGLVGLCLKGDSSWCIG